jgi:hypothetical protein
VAAVVEAFPAAALEAVAAERSKADLLRSCFADEEQPRMISLMI